MFLAASIAALVLRLKETCELVIHNPLADTELTFDFHKSCNLLTSIVVLSALHLVLLASWATWLLLCARRTRMKLSEALKIPPGRLVGGEYGLVERKGLTVNMREGEADEWRAVDPFEDQWGGESKRPEESYELRASPMEGQSRVEPERRDGENPFDDRSDR
jgi:hypothetical protein